MKNRKRYLRYKAKQKKINKYGTWLGTECPICGEKGLFYYHRYDAECCVFCDSWIAAVCKDSNCPFCSICSRMPSEAFSLEAFSFQDTANSLKKDWLRRNYQHKNDGKLRHTHKRLLYETINSKRQLHKG